MYRFDPTHSIQTLTAYIVQVSLGDARMERLRITACML